MPSRHRTLTAAQWRRVDEISAEWTAVASDAAPDRDRAGAAFGRLYANTDDPPPALIWTDSPFTAHLVCWLLVGFDGAAYPFAPLAELERVIDTHPAWSGIDADAKAAVVRALRPAFGDAAPAGAPTWQPPGPLSHGAGAYRRQWLTHLRGVPSWERVAISLREDRELVNPWDPLRATKVVPVERVLRRAIRRAVRPDLVARIEEPFAGPPPAAEPAVPHPLRSWLDSAQWSGRGVTRRFDGQLDAAWVGRHEVYPRLGLVDYPPQAAAMVDILGEISRSCGRWWALKGAVVAAERQPVVEAAPADLRGGLTG